MRDRLMWLTDLLATLVFAVEGAAAGVIAHVDLLGVAVLGFVTAVGGGIIRDLLLGEHPPAALRTLDYLVVIAVGVTIVIVIYQGVNAIPVRTLAWLDAFGLGLFAVTGAAKAFDHQLAAAWAVILGAVTGCGGGVLRDVLLNQVPTVLRAHIYAVAALLGAAVTVALLKFGQPRTVAFVLGTLACVGLRMLSVYLNWNLPRVTT